MATAGYENAAINECRVRLRVSPNLCCTYSVYVAFPLHDKIVSFCKNIKPGCIASRLHRRSDKEGIIFFLTVFHSNIESDFS